MTKLKVADSRIRLSHNPGPFLFRRLDAQGGFDQKTFGEVRKDDGAPAPDLYSNSFPFFIQLRKDHRPPEGAAVTQIPANAFPSCRHQKGAKRRVLSTKANRLPSRWNRFWTPAKNVYKWSWRGVEAIL